MSDFLSVQRVLKMEDDIEHIRRKMVEEFTASAANTSDASGQPFTLTDSNFNEFISGPDLKIVDFWAVWCAPCRFVSPLVEEMAKEYAGRVKVGKLNVDENQMTSARYGIRSIPTIMFFKNGKPVDSIVGVPPRNHLEGKIVQNLR